MASDADRRLFWSTAGGVVLLDLATKILAAGWLARRPLEIVGDYVVLRLVYNEGAAFGITFGAASRWIFFALELRMLALALVCGGAAGNLIDRIRSAQGVVDFIEVGIGPHRFPTFNVADSAITVGAIALAISLWLEGRHYERTKEAGAAPAP